MAAACCDVPDAAGAAGQELALHDVQRSTLEARPSDCEALKQNSLERLMKRNWQPAGVILRDHRGKSLYKSRVSSLCNQICIRMPIGAVAHLLRLDLSRSATTTSAGFMMLLRDHAPDVACAIKVATTAGRVLQVRRNLPIPKCPPQVEGLQMTKHCAFELKIGDPLEQDRVYQPAQIWPFDSACLEYCEAHTAEELARGICW